MAGKTYRKGTTLAEVFRVFPDDAAAEKWFAGIRWPDQLGCPKCGSVNVQDECKHKTMPYRCCDCAKKFSVRTGTVMEKSKLGYQTWAIAIYLLNTSLKGVASTKLARDLGITQKSAWYLAHRIRETWDDSTTQFSGPVEVDEAYMGGSEKNKRAHQKLHAGRGTVGKAPVVGVKDRKTGKVRARAIADTAGPTLRGFVRDSVRPGAQVYSDGHAAYVPLDGEYRHAAVEHGVGTYVIGQAHTNGIESFWSMLKRGYVGTYHQMSPKHLDRYVREFSGRHNVREMDTLDQMRTTARGLIGKRLPYAELVS